MKKSLSLLFLFVLFLSHLPAQSQRGSSGRFGLSIHYKFGLTPNLDDAIIASRSGLGVEYAWFIKENSGPGAQIDFLFFPLLGILKDSILLFNIDAKIFWAFQVSEFELRPFAGYDFALSNYKNTQTNHQFLLGFEMIFRNFGIEYSFIGISDPLVVKDFAGSGDISVPGSGTMHRLGFTYRIYW